MKSFFTLSLILIINGFCFAQKTDTSKTIFEENCIYEVTKSANTKLLIFLHGGVANPYFNQPSENIPLSYLVENNRAFFIEAEKNNFDVYAPITNTTLDWVNKPDEAFEIFNRFIESKSKTYEEVYISGFSDGGTGAYKIFYNNPASFAGLVLFNGYPQHENFYRTVNYSFITDQKVAFFGTLNDDIIPYEFLMTEYCKQKEKNSNSYLYLIGGNHSFLSYSENDFSELFDIFKGETNNRKKKPIQGFIKSDKVIEMYPYRKKILKKFNYGEETYQENLLQLEKYKK